MNDNLSDDQRDDLNKYLNAESKLRQVQELLGEVGSIIDSTKSDMKDRGDLTRWVRSSEISVSELQRKLKRPKQ